MAVTSIDHVRQSVRRLLWQFQDRPHFRSIVQVMGVELNALETALLDLSALRIATEEGAQLDRDGALLGVLRNGRSDADYRAAIQGQIRINRGNATVADVLFALDLALPGGTFELSRPEAATVRVDITTALTGSDPLPAELLAILDRLLGGGIRHRLLYSGFDASARFTFADGDSPMTDPTLGLASDTQSSGGYWSDMA